ncbi:MAG: hypothetical protein PHS81_02760 [Candidatus Nanoarchaeia archaeon]|nr:hypothetical protein [Candidatus Nanoarchaeia archaeon]
MNKVFLLYLLCISASLLFLSAYFSLAFFEYIESIFYMISMILVLSTLFLFLLSNKQMAFGTKILMISFFFFIMNMSFILIKNLFTISAFTSIIFSIFEQFSFIAFGCLLAIFSYSLAKPIKSSIFILFFSPLIFYSLLLFFFSYQGFEPFIFVNYFLIIFTITYDFFIVKNAHSVYKDSAELKFKSSLIFAGLIFLFSFAGFKQAGMFFFLNSIFITAGAFIFCFGVLSEKSLDFYGIMFNKIIDSLPSNLRGKYISWLLKTASKMEGLSIKNEQSRMKIIDNPYISNADETRKYDELLAFSASWIKRRIKKGTKKMKSIRGYYNNQKFLTKKLSQFSL